MGTYSYKVKAKAILGVVNHYLLHGDFPHLDKSEYAVVAMALQAFVGLPAEPTHDMLKALAGDPAILAASDEEELRRRYGVMRERLISIATGERS
jgi:hypothetical protein